MKEEFIPSEEEKKRIRQTISKLERILERATGYDVMPAGSTAKDTFLSGDTDIDLFIITDKIEDTFNKIKKLFPKGREKKGALKIWNVKYGNYDVDIVVVNPKKMKRWFTLEHTSFYLKALTPKMRDEVRRLKALFKSYTCYGAENGGITGVALEELVRRFGDSINVCREILAYDKPFWLQDPCAEKHGIRRNLLASVYPEKWELIQDACKEYLKERTIHYERPTARKFAKIRQKQGWQVLTLPSPTGQKDKDFQKAYSLCLKTCKELKNYEKDIKICTCDAYSDGKEVSIAFKIYPTTLSKYKEVCIPQGLPEEYYQAFKRKHPNWYIKDAKICAKTPRKITNPIQYMETKLEQELYL